MMRMHVGLKQKARQLGALLCRFGEACQITVSYGWEVARSSPGAPYRGARTHHRRAVDVMFWGCHAPV